jgi:asparagine synthase (glutamine-hydrolysing)
MCGIVSIVSPQGGIDQSRLKRATDALAHRGPDGEGFWIAAHRKAALGHRRLSIIDIDGGQQPISNEDKTLHIVVNGEFYGFEDIRKDLQTKGHVFSTGSDSEIALHLYEEYGVDCLKYLRGEFAFILWDEKKHKLFAARDRFGIKPLCYAQHGQELLIASEAKALFAAGVPARWDDYAFFHAASLQYTPQDRTLFKDIHQLKPGHFMVLENQKLSVSKYWDADYPVAEKQVSEADALAAFSAVFEESIRLRLRSDVPVCAHLSGGLDSSAVLAMAGHIRGKPLPAFTVCFEEESYDEFSIAAEMARKTGSDFYPVRLSQQDLVSHMSDAVYHGEGLAINGHLVGKYLLNKKIRAEGYKVALTGEGADEILAGYPHLRQDLYQDQPAVRDLYKTNAVSVGVQLAFGEQLPLEAVRNRLGYIPAFLAAKASLGYRFTSLLSPEFKNKFSGVDCYADLMAAVDIPRQLKGRPPVNQSLYLWNKLALANYILRTLGDGMEMSHSVEGRLPFLDHKVFECARSLPMSFKIRGKTEKYILREAAKPYITETVYKREKHPFMAPPVSVFSNAALDTMIGDIVHSRDFAALPFFDHGRVRQQLQALKTLPQEERAAWEPVLMMVLTAHFIGSRFGLRGAA